MVRVVKTWSHLDWLALLLASWATPILLVSLAPAYHYFWSLAFWTIPIGLLGWRALQAAQPDPESGLNYSRRRRGLAWATLYVLGGGLLLDYGLGRWVLKFALEEPGQYVISQPPLGIPVEEVFFYALAPLAILLVYVWCDEYWMPAYNRRDLNLALHGDEALVRLSPGIAVSGVAALVLGILYRRPWVDGGWPVYFIFLVIVAFVPTAMLFRQVEKYVNWPALGATTLYAVGTAILWEATLAVPRRWWGYQAVHSLGIYVKDWSRSPDWPFPIEASAVWVCAPLSCVLVYEFAKSRAYREAARRRDFDARK